MKKMLSQLGLLFVAFILLITGCKKDTVTDVVIPVTPPVTTPFDINTIQDTYGSLALFSNYKSWGSYNVHDPAVIKIGGYYYMYSTDAGYGIDVRPGLQIRKSKDLVEWTFVGWVFNYAPSQAAAFISQNGGVAFNSVWAPCIVKVGNEFRLYYSLSSGVSRLSVIGMATATNPEGPWMQQGLVVTSKNDNTVQTNAIDPSVIVTPAGEHWMSYGSAYDGIYILKLDPATGLALTSNDKGKRIANRGFTNNKYNGNIEGSDIIYNASLNKYYMFMAHDWIDTKYNVRVVRADKPDGPYVDFNGVDANTNVDHGPMIIAPYQFAGHGGWQGTAHSTTFQDGNGQYFIAHQGRPSVDKYFMDLHVRKIFWTQSGWPVASPERYAWEKDSLVSQASLIGDWEQIILGYTVVPGYSAEQINPNLQTSATLTLAANGTINGNAANTWTYTAPWLQLNWANGFTDKVFVQAGRDWENKKATIIFTGLNNTGTAIWGKKK